jgi:Zn-dependent peptidase ImmA (M78 family)
MERFGQRLKAARKMAGLSMEALSDATGNIITKQAISKYENGQMKPDSQKLIALAKALGVSTGYFYRESEVELTGIEFRKKSRLTQKEIARIENCTLDFIERYIEIEKTVGQEAVFQNPLKGLKVHSYSDIEVAAEKLRKVWRLGESPIPNLIELLEDKGVCVYEIDSNEKFDGLSGFIDGSPVLILNNRMDLVRKRFTTAHELGHLILNFPKVERKLKEKMCHAFAGALLIPKNAMYSEIGKSRNKITLWELKKLKGIYGISLQAIMARAHTLGIITDYYYKNFCIYANKAGWRAEEPGEYIGKEKANRFDQLVYYAVAEEIVTMSKGAELMNIKLPQFRRTFQIAA